MQCKTCPIKGICISYEAIKKIREHASVTITDCIYNNYNSKSETLQSCIPEVKNDFPKVMRNFAKESREAAMKKEEADNLHTKVIIQDSHNEESIIVSCPTCGGKTTADDLIPCNTYDCAKLTCSNCSTLVTEGTHKGKRLCNECWKFY